LNQKQFARTGRKVSEIGMGTYYDPLWIATAFLGWKRRSSSKVAALKTGLEAGISLIDTAELYKSETLVSDATRERKREDLFLATKAWSNHLHRDDLIRSFEKSLKRLGTPYIDLYQVHFPNPRVPVRETMGAMEELVSQGKLMHIGVSNFSLARLEEANSALPKSQLSSVQLSYNLLDRSVEKEILPYCDREGIALLAYFPLGHGRLASEGRLEGPASKVGKTKSQVALRWLASKQNVFPIPRASRTEHVVENAGASGWELPLDVSAEIDLAFPAIA
jgi:diketogulonate reductase-like aldo/keto reductase